MSIGKKGPNLSRRLLLGGAAAGGLGAAAAALTEAHGLDAETAAPLDRPKVGFALQLDGVPAGFFRSLSGISSESEVVEVKSGDGTVRKIPGRLKWGDIVLERGFTATDDLWQWRKLVIDGKVDAARKDGTITAVLLKTGKPIAKFNFYEGWPAKWYVPDMDSDQSGMAIEKIEIAVERVERA